MGVVGGSRASSPIIAAVRPKVFVMLKSSGRGTSQGERRRPGRGGGLPVAAGGGRVEPDWLEFAASPAVAGCENRWPSATAPVRPAGLARSLCAREVCARYSDTQPREREGGGQSIARAIYRGQGSNFGNRPQQRVVFELGGMGK